ncbi:MAG: hypothetical protein VX642_03430 [Bdellovibrionota bacterium]|nr:hypothetical protein [Bdellovibrionota bacterium]
MKYVLGLIFCLVSNFAFAGYALVANKGLGLTTLTKAQAKAIFNGATDKTPGGKNVTLAYIGSGPVADAFFKEITENNVKVFEGAWLEKALSGAGVAPEKQADSAAVIAWVKSNASGVAFIDDAKKAEAGDLQIVTVN